MRQFASDNYSGICPEALDALLAANQEDAPAYGDDVWTQRASDKFRELFETDCDVFFVFNGTAANSLSLASLCQSYHSVICHETAHVETDECGGPEFASNGSKLLLARGDQGKLDPVDVERLVVRRQDLHYPKPKAVSLTQATELGTVYRMDELETLRGVADRYGLKIHMDGARFANALASLECAPKDVTWRAGVDVLCLGGTKNGMAVGEAIIFFDRDLAADFAYRCKQAGQLASKMRFIAAPWCGVLDSGAWLRNARHANAMAALLEHRIREMTGLTPMFPREANSVFFELPQNAIADLRARDWRFYTFIGAGGVRLMCSWNTSKEKVEAFALDLRDSLRRT
ncbi:MAG: low specificity L-threonine aldolase [Deltaproteobacteria bacterium]|nr:low specificity L-threonine aldolase [Deltaproteobacteria bacterium]